MRRKQMAKAGESLQDHSDLGGNAGRADLFGPALLVGAIDWGLMGRQDPERACKHSPSGGQRRLASNVARHTVVR